MEHYNKDKQMTTKYARIEEDQIVEVELSRLHVSNRNDKALYLPIKPTVKPEETDDIKVVPIYSIKEGYVLKEFSQVQRSDKEKPRFIKARQKLKQNNVTLAVERHLNKVAKDRGYDSILSACTYSGYPNPFKAEGDAFVAWRGNVWAYCYQVLAEVEAGKRPEPTIRELLADLPVLAI